MKYKLIVDYGKPFEEIIKEEDLFKKLKGYSNIAKDSPYFDLKVENEKGEDITESQFITEMIGKIK